MKTTIWCVFDPSGLVMSCGMTKAEALAACGWWLGDERARGVITCRGGEEAGTTYMLTPEAEKAEWALKSKEIEA